MDCEYAATEKNKVMGKPIRRVRASSVVDCMGFGRSVPRGPIAEVQMLNGAIRLI